MVLAGYCGTRRLQHIVVHTCGVRRLCGAGRVQFSSPSGGRKHTVVLSGTLLCSQAIELLQGTNRHTAVLRHIVVLARSGIALRTHVVQKAIVLLAVSGFLRRPVVASTLLCSQVPCGARRLLCCSKAQTGILRCSGIL